MKEYRPTECKEQKPGGLYTEMWIGILIEKKCMDLFKN